MSPEAPEPLPGPSQGLVSPGDFPNLRGTKPGSGCAGNCCLWLGIEEKNNKKEVCSVSAAIPSLPSGVTGRSRDGAGRALGPCRGWEWRGRGPAVPWALPGGFAAVNRGRKAGF